MNTPPRLSRDRRYTIRREWCGYARQRHVVRFCGDWVGQESDRPAAMKLAEAHRAARLAALDLHQRKPE